MRRKKVESASGKDVISLNTKEKKSMHSNSEEERKLVRFRSHLCFAFTLRFYKKKRKTLFHSPCMCEVRGLDN